MLKKAVKRVVRTCLPLSSRRGLAVWMNKRQWLPARKVVCGLLLSDLYETDPKEFHKFLWAHHIEAYAKWYDSEDLFDVRAMEESRRELFADIATLTAELGWTTESYRSVLEVGCSLGHLLYFLERGLLPHAERLVGIDIDGEAIAKGRVFLEGVGSKVQLIEADMEDLDDVLGRDRFDVVLAAGVLSYLNQRDALGVVQRMLERTRRLLILVGLAHPGRNNNELVASELTANNDGQWIHNFEALARQAGGWVVRSRWEGARLFNEQTICFVFVVPAPLADHRDVEFSDRSLREKT